jgi:hypothetical protein
LRRNMEAFLGVENELNTPKLKKSSHHHKE